MSNNLLLHTFLITPYQSHHLLCTTTKMYVAEYLPRLCKISIKLDLPHDTKLISAVGIRQSTLVIQTSTTLVVPLPIHDLSILELSKVTGVNISENVMSLIITVNGSTREPEDTSFMSLAQSGTQKWSVKDLVKKTPRNSSNINEFEFCCGKCDLSIIKASENKFMDMPSEFWHEMMDFWHCHKPHEHHHLDNDKNYNGKLLPAPGNVHIGASYILTAGEQVECPKCGQTLGVAEEKCVRLFKWNMKLKYGNTTETFPAYAFVFYLLLDKVNSSAIRKVSVRSESLSMNVWVSNLGLDVSVTGTVLTNALKILYVVSPEVLEDEVIDVPAEVFDSFREQIEDVYLRLPEESRTLVMLESNKKIKYCVSYLLAE